MMSFADGIVTPGLAVETDDSLPHDKRLPVLTNVSKDVATKEAVAWAFTKFSALPENVAAMYCAGAAVVITYGLCRRVGENPDGDWDDTKTNTPNLAALSDADKARINIWLSKKNLESALTVIVATKVNWWLTDRHVDSDGVLREYMLEVYGNQFGRMLSTEQASMFRTIGRWASTLDILTLAGITGLFEVSKPLHEDTVEATLREDAKQYFAIPPVGTRRMIIACVAVDELVRTPLARFSPRLDDISIIPTIFNRVLERPENYQIKSLYLTGTAWADCQNTIFESKLGRLGNYVRVMHKTCSYAFSPYFDQEQKVQSCGDYSPEWYFFLLKFNKNGSDNSEMQAIQSLENISSAATKQQVTNAVLFYEPDEWLPAAVSA